MSAHAVRADLMTLIDAWRWSSKFGDYAGQMCKIIKCCILISLYKFLRSGGYEEMYHDSSVSDGGVPPCGGKSA